MTAPVPGYGPGEGFVICGSGQNGIDTKTYQIANSATGMPAANVYQGVVNANQVTFYGVPILPPGTNGARVLRITNIRMNANGIAGGGVVPIQASVSTSDFAALPLPRSASAPIVAFVLGSLTTSVGVPAALSQCSAQTLTQANILNFTEDFGRAFQTRVDTQPSVGEPNGYGGFLLQNVPGHPYNSELGFTLPVPGGTAGLADFGTRLKAVFSNVPAGARLFVSATNVNVVSGAVTSPVSVPPPSSTAAFAQLVTSETVSDGSGVLPVAPVFGTGPPALAPGGSGTIQVVEITPAPGSSTATAVWEVINADPIAIDTLQFAAFISYASAPNAGTALVNLSYAPISVVTTASQSATIPRFVDTSSAAVLTNVVPCANPVVSAISSSPNTGSGAAQTFTLQFSDTNGSSSLATTWAWFNATFANSSAHSCLAYYNLPANTVYLLNDAGNQWASATPGSSTILQNSQCSINASGVSAALNGSSLTLTLPMAFNASFNGNKNIYLYGADSGGASSGWQTRGTWTVPPPVAPAVTADSVSPNTRSGSSQTFALQYSDSQGAASLSTAWAWFNATFAASSANSCLSYYNRSANTLYLLNDAGNQWMSGTPGNSTTLQNSQCSINLGSSTATPSGNSLTLNLAMTFTGAFAGSKNIYMFAAEAGGLNSGWQTRGTWTVPPPVAPAVTADSASPNTGSGSSQTFALQYSDSQGAASLSTVWAWFNATFAASSANSCLVYYNRNSNTLYLLNDAGNQWVPGTPGSSTTLQNSQCSVSLASSSATPSGNSLTLNLAMTFTGTFSGSKNIYMFAAESGGLNSGWQTRGTWTVP